MKDISIWPEGFLKELTIIGMAEVLKVVESSNVKYYRFTNLSRGVLHLVVEDKDEELIVSLIKEHFPKYVIYSSGDKKTR